jgi:hypothetical protein
MQELESIYKVMWDLDKQHEKWFLLYQLTGGEVYSKSIELNRKEWKDMLTKSILLYGPNLAPPISYADWRALHIKSLNQSI